MSSASLRTPSLWWKTLNATQTERDERGSDERREDGEMREVRVIIGSLVLVAWPVGDTCVSAPCMYAVVLFLFLIVSCSRNQ